MNSGIIIKQISNQYSVLIDNKEVVCRARGLFRKNKITPLVGDYVVINKDNVITEIKGRKNELKRPNVANVDQAIVVVSVTEPTLDLNLLDKLLIMIEYSNIEPIICFTKLDMLMNDEIKNIIKYYQTMYKVVTKEDKEELMKVLRGKVSVLAGQSGSGKSTLLNFLDDTLNLKTAPISKSLGRGKHTTRHVELIHIDGANILDTPGFSSITLSHIDKQDLKHYYRDFNKYNDTCEYRDCNHINELKCGIKNNEHILKSRYENYIKFYNE